MGSRYRRGRDLENRTRKELERHNFTVVRSAGSKGTIDIVAWDRLWLRLIQVKTSTRDVTPVEREALEELWIPRGARVELWTWRKDGGRWTFDVEVIQDRT